MGTWGMTLTIHIKPNARQDKVEVIGDNELKVYVRAPAVDGKANDALILVLAKHFKVAKSRIAIVRGHTARIKHVVIE